MKLLGRSKKDVDQNKDREVVPKLESVEVVLVHCNLVNNSYQQAFKVLFTFAPNKQFSQLNTFTPHSPTTPLEIENNVNITLIIGTC